jgi:hypothetical protein
MSRALERRHVGGRQVADRSDHVAGTDHVALIGADCPEVGVLIEDDLNDALTEQDAEASTQPARC